MSSLFTTLDVTLNSGFISKATQPAPSSGGSASLVSLPSVPWNNPKQQIPNFEISIGNGVLANTANQLVYQPRVIGPGASETLVLFGTGLVNVYGNSCGFTAIKGLYVGLLPNPTGGNGASNITIGGGANACPLWFGGGTPLVENNGVPYQAGSPKGQPVTANQALTVTNNDSGNAATYLLGIVGV